MSVNHGSGLAVTFESKTKIPFVSTHSPATGVAMVTALGMREPVSVEKESAILSFLNYSTSSLRRCHSNFEQSSTKYDSPSLQYICILANTGPFTRTYQHTGEARGGQLRPSGPALLPLRRFSLKKEAKEPNRTDSTATKSLEHSAEKSSPVNQNRETLLKRTLSENERVGSSNLSLFAIPPPHPRLLRRTCKHIS